MAPGIGEAHTTTSRLGWHLAAFTVVLLVVAAIGPSRTPWTSDDGAYATAARSVVDRERWDIPYWFADGDPTGAHFPLANSEQIGERWFPYVKHPVWILALAGSYRLFGTAGLFLPSILAALAAAAAAWRLAGELDRRWRAAAFWLAAAGPLVIHAGTLWAHAAGAAAAGWAAVVALRCLRHDGPDRAAGLALAASLTALVAVRAEGALFAGSLLAALAFVSVRPGVRWARLAWMVLPSALGVSMMLVATALWRRSFGSSAATGMAVRDGLRPTAWLPGRASGLWATLARSGETPASMVLGLALLVVLGVVANRSRQLNPRGLPVLACIAAGLVVARVLVAPNEFVGGFLPAWPAIAFGLALWRRAPASAAERVLAATAGLFGTAVALTQYPEGGGLEWGGRFLVVALVPMAVLATAGAARAIDGLGVGDGSGAERGRLVLAAAAAAMITVPALHAVGATERERRSADGVLSEVVVAGAPVVVSTSFYLPRIGWAIEPQPRWLTAAPDDVEPLLASLAKSGDGDVALLAERPGRLVPSNWTVVASPEPWLTVIRFDG